MRLSPRISTATALVGLALILLGIVSCEDHCTCPDGDGQAPWALRDGEMNLAIVLVDYETYGLQGANVSYYEPCDGCAEEGLPLEASYHPPGDFGSMTFVYTATGDTVFDATIIWMGRGRIHYPSEFLPRDRLGGSAPREALPPDVTYFDGRGRPHTPDQDTIERTTRAWRSVASLDLVHAFAEEPYKVGFYLYPPTVGLFDPSVAQWVIFLYRDR